MRKILLSILFFTICLPIFKLPAFADVQPCNVSQYINYSLASKAISQDKNFSLFDQDTSKCLNGGTLTSINLDAVYVYPSGNNFAQCSEHKYNIAGKDLIVTPVKNYNQGPNLIIVCNYTQTYDNTQLARDCNAAENPAYSNAFEQIGTGQFFLQIDNSSKCYSANSIISLDIFARYRIPPQMSPKKCEDYSYRVGDQPLKGTSFSSEVIMNGELKGALILVCEFTATIKSSNIPTPTPNEGDITHPSSPPGAPTIKPTNAPHTLDPPIPAFTNLGSIFNIFFVFIPVILTLLIFTFIIIGAVKILTAGSDDKKKADGIKTITNAIIGGIVVILSVTIIIIIQALLSIKLLF